MVRIAKKPVCAGNTLLQTILRSNVLFCIVMSCILLPFYKMRDSTPKIAEQFCGEYLTYPSKINTGWANLMP